MPEGHGDHVDGLSARDLHLLRGERPVLRDVSFDAPKGSVSVVVAPSGAGKSTLLRCLNRLLVPQAGTILLDGVDVEAIEPCLLRRRVGLVGQVPVMLPGSVRENLLYALAAIPEDTRLVRALADAGLDASFLERPAGELSGGERARVALARALVRDPEVLLLDEPTAALDADVAARVGTTLVALAGAGIAIVLATHDLAFAAGVADRVVTLRDGVAVSGSPADLLTSARTEPPA
ncbi:MAG TPA: ABC transporter ATP-binding protein [Conexibacter sp.]|nr:ABC transporter ATP-binding protein [Conexibacter sp.]